MISALKNDGTWDSTSREASQGICLNDSCMASEQFTRGMSWLLHVGTDISGVALSFSPPQAFEPERKISNEGSSASHY